jgi:hypothetical protein
MAKRSSKKAAQTAAAPAPETETIVPPVPSSPVADPAAQEVLGSFPPGQQPLSRGGETAPDPLTQPDENGLIAPLPGSAPAGAANQPPAETTNPHEAGPQPPPSTEGAGEGDAAAPAQNLPDPAVIARAGAYTVPAGKPSNVIRRYVTPMPPDVLAGKP